MPTTSTRAKRSRAAARVAPKKIDLYKEFAAEYVTPKTPVMVDVGPAMYLTIDGKGEPGGEAFSAAVGALYSVAYTVKMARKFAARDYAVAKLEGLWWTERPTRHFMETPRSDWHWKLMIRTPDFVTQDEVAGAIEAQVLKGKSPIVRAVHLERIDEGRCVQVLHVGAYADEPRSLKAMQDVADAAGVKFTGRHHEIYLSDPMRTAAEKLRTILRHPVG